MGKLFWTAVIISLGIVGHFDSPEAHHPADISEVEKREYIAAYTTIDQYQAVTLNAIERGKQ